MPPAVAELPVVPAATPAPVAAVPAPAPATPAATPAPVSATPAAIPAPVPTPEAAKPSLLDSAAKPADATKPADAKLVDAPATVAEIVLKAPEGVTVSDEELKGVAEFAKAQGLSQKQAEAQLGRELAARGSAERAQAALMTKTLDESRKSFESDPDYGGPKLQESLQSARRGLDYVMPNGKPLVPAELKPLILQHFGDSAPVLKLLSNLGSLLREDSPPSAGNLTAGGKVSDAQLFYPQHYKK